MKGLSTWFINLMNVLGALVNPKGITNHSYSPNFVLKVVFHSSLSLSHSDLMIATSQINFCKDDSTTKLIKHVIKSRYGVSIPYCDVIYSSAINTHSP